MLNKIVKIKKNLSSNKSENDLNYFSTRPIFTSTFLRKYDVQQ